MAADMASADVAICGAGIAGVAAAYYLTTKYNLRNVVLIDERPPLTLTSDKSSEAYRNWWPGPGDDMVRFMDRSIDLLDELARVSDNRFHMNRRGYVYLTADPHTAAAMHEEALEIAQLGAGLLRIDEAQYAYQRAAEDQVGADLITDSAQINESFPFIASDALAMLHARRCGWLSAQQLGMTMLEQARACGVRLISGKVIAADVRSNQLRAVNIHTAEGPVKLHCGAFVNAAGPLLTEVGRYLGLDLPVYNELHGKIAFEDTEEIIPRDVPLMIWNDPIELPWDNDERIELAADPETAYLLDPFPPGLHFRPEGGPGSKTVLVVWPYHIEKVDPPVWPLRFEPEFVEIIMRGLVRMVPGLSKSLRQMSRPAVDGGYYCKTRENRPLICPLPVKNTFVIGALSGYGIMAAPAAAELLSAHITGGALPAYAPAFDLSRYADPHYQALLRDWSATAGQL